jgi:hypothetical protein
MIERFTAPSIAIVALLLAACVTGEIEGPVGGTTRRRDAGPTSGGTTEYPGDDLPDPAGDDPAPPPPEDPVDSGTNPPPSSPTDSGTAPAPPTDTGTMPAPPPDTAPPPATGDYPSGPYGLSVGSVIPNLSLSGYRDGTGAWTTIKTSDYYDPTGSRGVKGLLITVSAAWCGPCQEEARDLVDIYDSKYRARGAKFLTSMIENSSRGAATQTTVDSWIKMAGTNFDIVADPGAKLLGGSGLPFNMVVDPRTMKVTKSWSGSDPGMTSIPSLDTVLTKNGG